MWRADGGRWHAGGSHQEIAQAMFRHARTNKRMQCGPISGAGAHGIFRRVRARPLVPPRKSIVLSAEKCTRAHSVSLLLSLTLMVVAPLIGHGADARSVAPETFGCEPNPTDDPVGGGVGYRNIHSKGDFTVRTAKELADVLKKARPGQMIYVPDGVPASGKKNTARRRFFHG